MEVIDFLLQEGQGQCPLFLDQRRTYSCPYQFILRQCNCQCTEKLKRPWNIRFEKQRTILLIQPNCQPRSPHRSLLKTCLCKRSSRNKLYPRDINGRDHILIHQLVYLVFFYFTSFLISPFSGNDPFLFFSFLVKSIFLFVLDEGLFCENRTNSLKFTPVCKFQPDYFAYCFSTALPQQLGNFCLFWSEIVSRYMYLLLRRF